MNELRSIPVELIDPDPAQARQTFDAGSLDDLAESIRQHGVLQPVEVEETADGRYRLHHGERRLRASRLAGRETISAVVAPPRDRQTALIRGLVENLHREDLNVIDEARIFQELLALGWTKTRLMRETGHHLEMINSRLAWLELEPEIQRLVAEKRLRVIDGKLARALAVLPVEARLKLAEKMAERGMGFQGCMKAVAHATAKMAEREERPLYRPVIHDPGAPPIPPLLRHAAPAAQANGNTPRPVISVSQAAEAMCRQCRLRPRGDVIPSWELVEAAAAATCAECVKRDGPAVPQVCALCPGVALLRRLVEGADRAAGDGEAHGH